MVDQRRRRVHAQRQHLALDRAHRRPQFRRQPGDAARPGAGRQHDHVGRDLAAVGQHDAVGARPGDRDFLDRGVLADGGAGRLGGDAQGGGELAVVDLVVLRAPHRAGELAGEMRLASSRLRRRNPLQRQAELLLEDEMMMQPRLVVRGRGDDQRAFGAQFHIDAGGRLQFGGKGRPARLAVAAERDQRFLAGLGLGAGGEHPGGGVAGARAGRAAVEHRDRCAARGQPPGDAEADDAGADDGDLGFNDRR